MSAARAYANITPAKRVPAPLPQKRPELKVIKGNKGERPVVVLSPLKTKSPLPFILICVTAFVSALVFVLVAQTKLISNQILLTELQGQIRVVEQDIQVKQEQLQRNQAELTLKATELGLVRAANPVPVNVEKFVTAVTGEVLGGLSQRSGQ